MSVQPSATLDVPFPMIAEGRIGAALVQTVDAREVHRFLEAGRDFTTWMKERIDQYGFAEDIDFVTYEGLSSPDPGSAKSRAQKTKEYALTLDMGKELGMVGNNDRGRQVRRYFIEQERLAKQNAPRTLTSAEMFLQSAQITYELDQRQREQAAQLAALDAKVDKIETAQTLLSHCPSAAEPITRIRKRIGKLHGLSADTIDAVIRQSPYAPKPAGNVRNEHVEADGSSYTVFWVKDISALFKRFVAECQPVTTAFFTHPFVEGRFRMSGKGEQV